MFKMLEVKLTWTSCVLMLLVYACLGSTGAKAASIVAGIYEDDRSGSCSGAPTCSLNFGTVPANSNLVIREISCYFTNQPSNLGVFSVGLISNGHWNWLPSKYIGTTNNTLDTNILNEGLTAVAPAGSVPFVLIRAPNSINYTFSVDCKMTGSLM
jgi:hypothetical protein